MLLASRPLTMMRTSSTGIHGAAGRCVGRSSTAPSVAGVVKVTGAPNGRPRRHHCARNARLAGSFTENWPLLSGTASFDEVELRVSKPEPVALHEGRLRSIAEEPRVREPQSNADKTPMAAAVRHSGAHCFRENWMMLWLLDGLVGTNTGVFHIVRKNEEPEPQHQEVAPQHRTASRIALWARVKIRSRAAI